MATPSPVQKTRPVKMQLFKYEGIDKTNLRVSGEISARSLPRAKIMLTAQGITILNIKRKSTPFTFSFTLGKKVKAQEIAVLTRQLSTMLHAGIPLVQALTIVAEGVSGPVADLARKIKLEVESGLPFSKALRKNPKYFDALFCSLVESGEQSGTLDDMLNRIAFYQEKMESLKRKIKKALYYPAAVLIIAVVVTAILLVKVVPTFKDMFKSFGAELPLFTQMVVNLSEFVQNRGFYLLCAIFLLVFFVRYLYKKRPGFRHMLQRLSLKLPVFGSLIKKNIVARFARTLATTSAAGVPLTEALESVARASNNIIYYNAIQKIREGLAAGQQMKTAMKRTEVFPPMVVQMIGIGEESGALEDMLSKVATIYEEEVDTAVDGLTTLLEPLIMILLGVIVGGLVVAMYLPIFKMGSIL